MTWLFPLLAGVLFILGFPTDVFKEGSLICLTFSLLILLRLRVSSITQVIVSWWIFNIPVHLIGYYWIAPTLQDFGQIPLLVSWIISFFNITLQFPQILALLFLRYWLEKNKMPKVPYSFFLVFGFVLSEALLPQIFPTFLGSSFINYPSLLSLAPIFGVYIYSAFLLWVALIINFALEWRKSFDGFLFVFLFLLMALFLKFDLGKTSKIPITIVQPNIGSIDQLRKTQGPKAIEYTFKTYSRLSKNTKNGLIIWPETSHPYSLYSKDMKIPSHLRELLTADREFLIGGYDRIQIKKFNSMFHFSSNQFKGVYHKQQLMPFGETLPLGLNHTFLKKYLDEIAYFDKGENQGGFLYKNKISFIGLICYEVLFEGITADLVRKQNPSFMVNLTNDSWYGDTIEPWQHLFLARWRAAEHQIPLIRSTNTGISAIISSQGQVLAQSELNKEEVLYHEVEIRENPSLSLFSRFSFWMALLFIIGNQMLFLICKKVYLFFR